MLQDFKVLTLLGKGSFACVYRAKSVNTGLEVAIKMVRKKLFCLINHSARVVVVQHLFETFHCAPCVLAD